MIREKIIEILNTMGLQITEYKNDELIREYIHDSLALVSFMVFIEDKFDIEIEENILVKIFMKQNLKNWKILLKNQ